MAVFELTVTPKMAGRMLKNVLQSDYKMSQRLLRHVVQTNGVHRNGKPMYLTARLTEGDKIYIMLPKEEPSVYPEPMDLDIRYEDDEVLVLNKPPGVLTHPSARERYGSLLAGVQNYLKPKGLVPHCVHRLDKGTSGVVLFAKHAHFHHLFDVALRQDDMHRSYAALVLLDERRADMYAEGWHTVDLPIGQNESMPSRRVIVNEENGGQRAVTHFRVLAATQGLGLVQLRLETGRTHQIRLHMASMGMPLLGDRDYDASFVREGPPVQLLSPPSVSLRRQALHAYLLGWKHPVTGEAKQATAPPAEDLKCAWRDAGGPDDVWSQLTE